MSAFTIFILSLTLCRRVAFLSGQGLYWKLLFPTGELQSQAWRDCWIHRVGVGTQHQISSGFQRSNGPWWWSITIMFSKLQGSRFHQKWCAGACDLAAGCSCVKQELMSLSSDSFKASWRSKLLIQFLRHKPGMTLQSTKLNLNALRNLG